MNKQQLKAKEERRKTRYWLKEKFGKNWYECAIAYGYINFKNPHEKWERKMQDEFDKLLDNTNNSKTGGWS